MLLAPTTIADPLRQLAREFLAHMQGENYDYVWNHLLTLDAMELVSTASFPLYIQDQGKIDAFILEPSAIDGMAFTFQRDLILPDDDMGLRTGFFQGLAMRLQSMGWFENFVDETSFVFVHSSAAVLVADTAETRRTLFLWFVQERPNDYKIDFEAFATFSMALSAQKLHRFATRAMEIGEDRVALQMYDFASRLSSTYSRIRDLGWDHPLVGSLLTEQRRQELQAEYAYTILAQEQLEVLRADPQFVVPSIDLSAFLRDSFRGYEDIPKTNLDDGDLERLMAMDDNALRHAVAKLLVGVDHIEALREARKPHTSAEIADMEVLVRLGNDLIHLLMPFKSGREIRGNSVPVEVFYQILRPHMFFEKGVVVFITAKPCSQPLMNFIKVSRDRQGWPIAVIEHEDLARLLKVNGFL